MIQTDFDFNSPINQAILLLTGVLFLLQCWLLVRKHRYSARFPLRLALNLLLGLSILAFVLKPHLLLDSKSNTALIIADNVPDHLADHWKDSLVLAAHLRPEQIADHDFDTLVLVGQEFRKDLFPTIRQLRKMPAIHWIPYFAPDQLQSLNWKGLLRNGDMQVITGRIGSSVKQVLKARFGGQTLDSVMLNQGLNQFRLTFPAFSNGRAVTELVLGDKAIDTLRYFARPAEKLTVQFLLESPDFETRNLANWLGKNGHAVAYEATLSTDIKTKLNINKAKEADLIITGPSNASATWVKKAVLNGKSVLFADLVNVPQELAAINAAWGTGFQARKVSNEDFITLSPELNALPFHFLPENFQIKTPHYPVVVEKTTGKIGVSLLGETFPVQLAGDSIAYQKIWNEILASVRPAPDSNAEWNAPVMRGSKTVLRWNQFEKSPDTIRIGKDTVFKAPTALNSRSVTASFRPSESGWQPVSEPAGTEMYVQDQASVLSTTRMQEFVKEYGRPRVHLSGDLKQTSQTSRRLPDWAWFAVLMVCFAIVWIEQKL